MEVEVIKYYPMGAEVLGIAKYGMPAHAVESRGATCKL